MSQMSDYLENVLANHVFRNVSFTSPTTVYVALFTSDPTDAGTGSEVSGGSYVRQVATFNAPVNGAVTNSDQISFPVATANWGTVTHIGMFDAQTSGNMLVYGPLQIPKQIDNGDQFIVKATALTITFA